MSSAKPNVFVAIRPELYKRLFSPAVDQQLRSAANLAFNTENRNLSATDLAAVIGSYDAMVSGWGTPAFTPEVLAAKGKLRLVAHSAGSVKHMVTEAFFNKGLQLTHAAAAIAPSVAEMSLIITMMMLRSVPQYMQLMRNNQPWDDASKVRTGIELAGTRVGVVGAGYTGRCFIQLLRAMNAEIWVYDPFLTDSRATEMGVKKVELHALLKECPVVSLQAPSTPETKHMIGKKELALLRDGAIFINTARSWLTDEAALFEALKTGRFIAALDVFDQEPLPADSPFRTLPNVYLTPHIAGLSTQTSFRQGKFMADEIERFFSGKPLQYQVTLPMLKTMA